MAPSDRTIDVEHNSDSLDSLVSSEEPASFANEQTQHRQVRDSVAWAGTTGFAASNTLRAPELVPGRLIGQTMATRLTSSLPRRAAAVLLALCAMSSQGLNAATDDTFPAAPTLRDAHQYFESLVAGRDVTALYETRNRNGDILGFESFPVEDYRGRPCGTVLTLKNGVKVDIDWAVSEKSQFGDGTLSILKGNDVQFKFFHMLSVAGGITVEPSTTIGRLIFGIKDELSRNRLAKAIDLVSNACRSKSKFD